MTKERVVLRAPVALAARRRHDADVVRIERLRGYDHLKFTAYYDHGLVLELLHRPQSQLAATLRVAHLVFARRPRQVLAYVDEESLLVRDRDRDAALVIAQSPLLDQVVGHRSRVQFS